MKIENFDYDEVGASHEVIEAFVQQTLYVSVWRHETSTDTVFSYTQKKLPDGFHGLMDVEGFTTRSPVEGYPTAVRVRIDLGEIEVDEVYDSLAEPLAKLMALSAALDRTC